MKYAEELAKGQNVSVADHIKDCIEEYTNTYTGVCPSEGFYFCLILLGIVHLMACLFLGTSYFVANYHRISLRFNPTKKMAIRWNAFYHFYLLALLICSGLGIWYVFKFILFFFWYIRLFHKE